MLSWGVTLGRGCNAFLQKYVYTVRAIKWVEENDTVEGDFEIVTFFLCAIAHQNNPNKYDASFSAEEVKDKRSSL